ncbi:MAG: 2-oxoglutarate dehydrogenase complex dihydrolipoyllysine-residue succinyltransferase, partial [Gammaproteobacteria bacterium]|nr:2-oxoglutarate dehydrogenase complex dihydrolipoyllysine-residue succinyltransferase [Gammaproteobacteria bacterium]
DTVKAQEVIATMDNSDAAKKQATQASRSEPAQTQAAPATNPDTLKNSNVVSMPSATRLMSEKGLDPNQIAASGRGGRVLKEDVLGHSAAAAVATAPTMITAGDRIEQRVPMTRLRKRIAERLVEAQQTAAMLTTFNEVNMQPVMDLRKRFKDRFEKQHGVRLGFMSFFVKACVEALKRFPVVNASIDADDIVYHGYFDVGIAVGSPRGLVVPILRDVDQMSIAQIEERISDFGKRAQEGKLSMEEITGGTFSITNGGVFGSLMSTPILNPPQSAILGMHKIMERPMVENGQIVARPMMYLALSYDHRIIDGREAVQFLVTIKDLIEEPSRILLEV